MSVVFPPAQIVVFPEIEAVMDEFTFTITVSFAFPQEDVTVTTYVVVETGFAVGLEMFGLFNPAAGDHTYAVPPDALSVVVPPLQIVTSLPADAVPEFVTVTSTG